jgi:hypothetical protein
MVTLGLGNPVPARQKLTAPAADPVARRVILWVGVSDPVLRGMRDRLPGPTKDLLHCCDQGFKHWFRVRGISFEMKRIRYDGKPLGYGIVVAEWQTIAPTTQKMTIPEEMQGKLNASRLILQNLGLVPRSHLTDRPSL